MRFVVECYLPADGRGRATEPSARAGAAARDLAQEGAPVRFVRSIYIPEDEIHFLLFEAQTAELAGKATELAGIPYERVLEAWEEEQQC